MHNLATSFPEMGQGLFALVILGAVLLLVLVGLVMVYSALQLVWARIASPQRKRRRSAPVETPIRVRVRAR